MVKEREDNNTKQILLITTGGTIASSDMGNGLTPSMNADVLLSYITDADFKCNINHISLMNIDSSNMTPDHMCTIADTIAKHYNSYDGFVITHGTDTCAYTAAALSYMLINSAKPVIITGSQLPINAKETDAVTNLKNAIYYACENINGVFVAFNGKLILGTRASKLNTKNADAFASINAPVIATIKAGSIKYNISSDSEFHAIFSHRSQDDFHADIGLCPDILTVKLFPGIKSEIFDFAKKNYKAVIIECFGIGGIPTQYNNILTKIHELTEAGIYVVITTQCLFEGVSLDIYEVGKLLSNANIIDSGDMTTESITMKLMWALAHCHSNDEIVKYMLETISYDRSNINYAYRTKT